jgi:hypothetical protein
MQATMAKSFVERLENIISFFFGMLLERDWSLLDRDSMNGPLKNLTVTVSWSDCYKTDSINQALIDKKWLFWLRRWILNHPVHNTVHNTVRFFIDKLEVDVENIVLKIYAYFSQSAKRTETLIVVFVLSAQNDCFLLAHENEFLVETVRSRLQTHS